MPFMKGRAPIRRTLNYLNAGKLVFKDKIKIFSVAYNIIGQNNTGAKEFVFWYLPQIQYKNPNVQVATLRNLTPSPFIKCYFEDGRKILVDIDNKSKEEILEHLLNTVGKSKEVSTFGLFLSQMRLGLGLFDQLFLSNLHSCLSLRSVSYTITYDHAKCRLDVL